MNDIEPLVVDLPDAGDDPVAILSRLSSGPFAFLLESAAGDGTRARYTFLGTRPREAWRYAGNRVERWLAEGGWQMAESTGDPIGHVGELVRKHQVAERTGLPPFVGGAVGFFGYDVVRTLEKLPAGAPDDLGLPDALFLIMDEVIVLDRQAKRASLYVSGDHAAERGRAIGDLLSNMPRLPALSHLSPFSPLSVTSTYDGEHFMNDVRALKGHIAAGDIFQAVLSRRLEWRGSVDPLHLYRSMRALNPAPYLYYLKLGDFAIVGGSPEVLVRVENDAVTVRPIAGTRPRGDTPSRDEELARELVADPKERAEHMMLVDLGRNDVGRVSAFGSVRVTESLVIERYAHVQHIVSEVTGTLAPGKDAVDALKACFPAGTVSGAPKVRAMELLSEREPVRRGPYAGAVGYIGWGARRLDTAITIRTCLVLPDRVIVQAGAGIVADSDPAAELAETEHKARGALRALALALAPQG